jgi:hypothetical protein
MFQKQQIRDSKEQIILTLSPYFTGAVVFFPKLSCISCASGKKVGLVKPGNGPPSHGLPVARKFSSAPSRPGLMGTLTRAYPARINCSKAGPSSSYSRRWYHSFPEVRVADLGHFIPFEGLLEEADVRALIPRLVDIDLANRQAIVCLC